MPFPDLARYGVLSALSIVLLWAAISDIVRRRIPNLAVLAILGLFLAWVLLTHGAGLGSALAAGAIAFVAGYSFYAFKVMGAGDAKLFAATALFAGLPFLPAFALATVLAGGIMAVLSLASRPRRALAVLTLRGKGDAGRGIPYGVAIAIAAVLVLWSAALGDIAPYALAPWG